MRVRQLMESVRPADPDGEWTTTIQTRLDALLKPPGSLGRLEELALRIGVAQGRDQPLATRRATLIFAGDHGVCDEAISAYQPEVTAQLCRAFAVGGGVVSALARGAGARVVVVDVGVDHDLAEVPGIRDRKIRRGTRNMVDGPAMTIREVEEAILAGAESVAELGEVDLIAVGEAGIGNTTVAAALTTLLTGAPAAEVVGRGTGVGDETLRRKAALIERVVEGYTAEEKGPATPLAALVLAGGFEFAALTGAILAAAARRIPVVLDGYATGVAALLATRLAPDARDYLIAAHRSAEPGHQIVLDELGLRPFLEWGLCLGEASGAVLVLPLAEAACALLREVPTFEEAGVEPSLNLRAIR